LFNLQGTLTASLDPFSQAPLGECFAIITPAKPNVNTFFNFFEKFFAGPEEPAKEP